MSKITSLNPKTFRKYLKPRRQRRYEKLRTAGLLPTEARIFSKLRAMYPALKAVIAERSQLLEKFEKRATRAGWRATKTDTEYRKTIKRWYKRNGYMQMKHPSRTSPWAWYEAAYDALPDDQKWDSPRAHRRTPANWENSSIKQALGDQNG